MSWVGRGDSNSSPPLCSCSSGAPTWCSHPAGPFNPQRPARCGHLYQHCLFLHHYHIYISITYIWFYLLHGYLLSIDIMLRSSHLGCLKWLRSRDGRKGGHIGSQSLSLGLRRPSKGRKRLRRLAHRVCLKATDEKSGGSGLVRLEKQPRRLLVKRSE